MRRRSLPWPFRRNYGANAHAIESPLFLTLVFDSCYVIFISMESERTYTLTELCELANLPKRTVRYYIQQGLLEPPVGAGRGARYHTRHLERLLEIRKWQEAGLSLERIRELVTGTDDQPVPPPRPRRPGNVEVWSHLYIDEGIELLLEPAKARLSPEQARALTAEVMRLYQRIRSGEKS